MYLFLYGYVILFGLESPEPNAIVTINVHWTEYLLYFWQLTFLLEEIRIVRCEKCLLEIELALFIIERFTTRLQNQLVNHF